MRENPGELEGDEEQVIEKGGAVNQGSAGCQVYGCVLLFASMDGDGVSR